MYEEIKELYRIVNVRRRFRKVWDGLWIFPYKTVGHSSYPAGIFVSKWDYEK